MPPAVVDPVVVVQPAVVVEPAAELPVTIAESAEQEPTLLSTMSPLSEEDDEQMSERRRRQEENWRPAKVGKDGIPVYTRGKGGPRPHLRDPDVLAARQGVNTRRPATTQLLRAQWRAFFNWYEKTANVQQSIDYAKMSYSAYLAAKANDPLFKIRFEEAKRRFEERLEAEVLRRAVTGVEKTKWHGGKAVGKEKTYSDSLLLALLQRRIRAYRQQVRVDQSGSVTVDANVDVRQSVMINVAALAPEQRSALRLLLGGEQARRIEESAASAPTAPPPGQTAKSGRAS